jgi:hypothetical protein
VPPGPPCSPSGRPIRKRRPFTAWPQAPITRICMSMGRSSRSEITHTRRHTLPPMTPSSARNHMSLLLPRFIAARPSGSIRHRPAVFRLELTPPPRQKQGARRRTRTGSEERGQKNGVRPRVGGSRWLDQAPSGLRIRGSDPFPGSKVEDEDEDENEDEDGITAPPPPPEPWLPARSPGRSPTPSCCRCRRRAPGGWWRP